MMHHCSVGHIAAVGKHEALGNHIASHSDGRILRAGDSAVFEACGTFYTGIGTDVDISDSSAIGYFGMFSHLGAFAEERSRVSLDHCYEALHQFAVVAIHGY